MSKDFFERIRSITKEEWQEKTQRLIKKGRLWLQDNPELGFITAFALGVFIATFFKLVVGLTAIIVILSFVVYHFAPEEPAVQESVEKVVEIEVLDKKKGNTHKRTKGKRGAKEK